MTLKTLKPFTRVVETPNGDITVRGLSLTDITLIFNRHRSEISAFAMQVKGGNSESDEFLAGVAERLLAELPSVAADIIAVATGELDEETVEIAGKLPAPIQLEVIDAVGGLTFHTEHQLKKAVETVIKLLEGATKSAALLRA